MNLDRLRDLLEEVKHGEVDVEAAIQSLRHLPLKISDFLKSITIGNYAQVSRK